MRGNHSFRVAFLSLVALGAPRPAAAAWPSDPQTNLQVCAAAGNQSAPMITGDGTGGAIVTWYDRRNGTDENIFAQHILASGSVDPTWPDQGRALCAAAGDQQYPRMVGDGSGGAIVTWHDGRSGTSLDIYAQHVMASGVVDAAWPANGRALCVAGGNQQYPTLVADGAGGAIVAWYDRRSGSYDIYAQRVLSNGTVDPAWPADGRALCTAVNDQFYPIVADGAGGAIITWYDYRSGTNYDVYAEHVLPNGVPDSNWPANGRSLCTAAGDQYSPAIVGDGAGGAIVAWYDNRNLTQYDIYAQHVLGSGAVDPAWPGNGRAVCADTTDQQYPQLVSDGSGGAIVTWEDLRNGNDSDIYAQHVLASGLIDAGWPTNGRALCLATDNQVRPTLTTDGAGGAIVTWDDIRNGVAYDIYAQRVMANGAVDPAWPDNGRALCTAPGRQTAPSMIPDGAGGAIVAWQDLRNAANYDVYAQRVQRNGQLGGGPVSVPEGDAGALALEPVRPNPVHGGAFQVRFTLATPAPASLELFDVGGRRIRGQDIGAMGAGHHAIDLVGGARTPPGVYLVRLQQGADVRVTRVAVLD